MRALVELIFILGIIFIIGYFVVTPDEIETSSSTGYSHTFDESEVSIIPGKVDLVFSDTTRQYSKNLGTLRGMKIKYYKYKVLYEISYNTKTLERLGVSAAVEKTEVDSMTEYYSFIRKTIPTANKTLIYQSQAIDSVKIMSVDSFKIFKNEIQVKLDRINHSEYSIE